MFIINYRSSLVFQYIKNEVLYEISVLTVKYEIAYVNQFLDQNWACEGVFLENSKVKFRFQFGLEAC